MEATAKVEAKQLRKGILGLLITLGGFAGIAPVFLALELPLWGLGYGLVYACTSIWLLHRLNYRTTAEPGLGAYLLGFVSALAMPAVAGAMMIMFYALAYLAIAIVVSVANVLGAAWQVEAVATPGALILALFVGAIMMLAGSAQTVRTLSEQLFPSTAGVPHAFERLLTTDRRQLWTGLAAALVVLIGLIVGFGLGDALFRPTFYGALQFYLFFAASTVFNLGQRPAQVTVGPSALAVGKLFSALGWDVVYLPRTQDPEIDPLLEGIDLLAVGDGRALLLDLQEPEEKAAPRVTWTAALGVLTAARALTRARESLALEAETVEPWLLLIDLEADDSLRGFEEAEPVHVLVLRDELDEVETADEMRCRQLAHRYFGKPKALPSLTPPAK